MTVRIPLLALGFLLAVAGVAAAQDLFERLRQGTGRDAFTTTEFRSRDRIDLQLTADATRLAGTNPSGSSRLGVSGTLDYDFACGRFDIKSSLEHLLGREAREELLGDIGNALLGEMAHNTLVLICESSPTVCQALQHYRISANAMLGMQYDWCQAVESAVDDSNRGTRARAIKDCIEEKRAQGKTLAQAREECEHPNRMRGLDGRFVNEIDVIEEIRRAFNLPEGERGILNDLVSSLRLSPRGGEGEIRTNAVLDRHGALVERYQTAWTAAVESARQGRNLGQEGLAALSPEQAGRVSPIEVAEIAALPTGRRVVVVRTVVSSAALFELNIEVGKVMKLLDAARKHPTADQGFISRLEKEREDLERQLAEVTRLYELQQRHNRTLLDANAVAQAEVLRSGTRSILSDLHRKEGCEVLERTPRWGTFPERSRATGAACDTPQPTSGVPGWGGVRR